MSTLTLALQLLPMALALPHAIAPLLFLRKLKSPVTPEPHEWPTVTVCLATRGADPTLAAAFATLLRQDYPRYRVQVTVDSEIDPSRAVLERVLADTSSACLVRIDTLQEPRPDCSLRCSATLQAIRLLDADTEVVVLVDSDAMLSQDWLRSLVKPLAHDPGLGASTGIRWYHPPPSSRGAVLRWMWNIFSTVPQALADTPWGGSLAITRHALDNSSLVNRWSQALVDDAPVKATLNQRGLRVLATPETILTSTEDCDTSTAVRFITRQTLWNRLYDPDSWMLVLHACVLFVIAFGVIANLAIGVVMRDLFSFGMETASLAVYVLIGDALICRMHATVTRHIADGKLADGETLPELPSRWLRWWALFAAPVMQLVAVVSNLFRRQVTWRGVVYDIDAPYRVSLREYHPYTAQPSEVSI